MIRQHMNSHPTASSGLSIIDIYALWIHVYNPLSNVSSCQEVFMSFKLKSLAVLETCALLGFTYRHPESATAIFTTESE